nr:Hsp70 family protein [Comamonas sp. JC664]
MSADTGDGAAASITSANASQSSAPEQPVGTTRGSADTGDGEVTPASAAPTAAAFVSQRSDTQEPDATANVRAESGGDAASGPESTALGTATSLSPNSSEKQPTAGHDALASTEAGPTLDQGTPQSDAAQTQPPLSKEPTAHDEQATSTQEPSPDGAGPRVPSSTAIPAARAEPESTPAVALDSDAPRNRRRSLFEVPVPAPASAPASPEVVLGIDLGTTQARVAYVQNGTPTLIPLPGTTATDLPALIAVNGNGDLVVGTSAQLEGSRAPRRAVPGLKRLLGLKPRSPQLRWLAPLLPYPVTTDTNGDAAVEVRGRVISPTLFTAMLLRELKHAAATHLGRKPTRAVICAPTHFTDRQCAALREAATLAGLDAQRILIAPAAAALAYAHGRGLARKRVLVVDLGGGGLQVCVVQVTGDDLEVITTGGDATLGGMDFDGRIAEALASDLSEQGVPKPDHPLDWMPLRAAAESTKVALSTQEQVDVTLPSGTVPPFNRERVEALTADLAQRVTTVVRDVLDSNALSPQGLDAVLLVGGQSATPMVRRRLEESLGVSVRDDVDAKNSVALGAALLGQGLLLAEAGKPAATVSEVLSTPLAVAERGGTLRRFLERNTRLPATKTLVLACTPGPLEVALFQGTSAQAGGAEYLGRVALHVDRAGEVELHFALTADGALAVEATLPGVKRHAVPLGTEPLDDAAFDALIARSPWEPAPEPRPGGLLSGIKKLFGRR